VSREVLLARTGDIATVTLSNLRYRGFREGVAAFLAKRKPAFKGG
jgi:hypothetical protein